MLALGPSSGLKVLLILVIAVAAVTRIVEKTRVVVPCALIVKDLGHHLNRGSLLLLASMSLRSMGVPNLTLL